MWLQEGTDDLKTAGAQRTTKRGTTRTRWKRRANDARRGGKRDGRQGNRWAAGAQLGVKSGRSERERGASSAQRNRKAGEHGREGRKQ